VKLAPYIPLFPLLGFLIFGLGRRRVPRAWVGPIASGAVLFSFVTSVVVFFDLLSLPVEARSIKQVLFNWVAAGRFSVDAAILIDPLSIVMALVVTGVGFLIHVYSIGYMHDDPDYVRYFCYLNLFMFMMLTLVLGANYLLMYVGWEGVGLCSYLLIGFWYTRDSAANAGKKAFIVNRIGDFGFALALMLLFWQIGSLDFGDIATMAPSTFIVGGGVITAICLLLFLGATGKSAQIPLYVWLPDAMEGPTPVSALIHAATMVTAGVYMVARSASLFVLSPQALAVVAGIGAATAIFAATIALAQNDIKKVLAYSTISQLGYMFIACGVGFFAAGIFHLMTHAFFKALLFLGAGSVIHGLHGEQDMRRMGGLKQVMPHTHKVMLIATLTISGIFPLSGFVSKDEILWGAYSGPYHSLLVWSIGVLAALLTAFYMFRLYFLTFVVNSRWPQGIHAHESPRVMTVPLWILAVLSIVGGVIGWPHALGGANWFGHFLEPVWPALPEAMHGAASTELLLMALALGLALGGILSARYLYKTHPERAAALSDRLAGLRRLLENKYWVDEIYDVAIVQPIVRGSIWLWRYVDVILIDGLANGLAMLTAGLGKLGSYVQTGTIRNYILVFTLGVALILGYYALAWSW
jgi:NADH-quinone oxidoreductase subunit L